MGSCRAVRIVNVRQLTGMANAEFVERRRLTGAPWASPDSAFSWGSVVVHLGGGLASAALRLLQ